MFLYFKLCQRVKQYHSFSPIFIAPFLAFITSLTINNSSNEIAIKVCKIIPKNYTIYFGISFATVSSLQSKLIL